MRKKWITAALVCTLILTGGCGKSKNAEADNSSTDSTASGIAGQYPDSKITKLGNYKGVEIAKDNVEVSDDEVQSEIDNLLASYPEYQKLDKTMVEDGDWVNIDFVGKKDGEAFEGGSSSEGGYDLLIGSGSFIDGFEDGLIGKNVGDSFELPLTFPDTYTPNPDLAGQDVVFDVTINAIEEQVDAEWNDAFVQKNTDYETVDEYVAATKESLQQQKDSDKAYYVMEAIVNDSEFEYADSDVQALVDTQKQKYEQYASYFGMSLDDFLSNSGMTDEKLEENARFQIGCTLAIDAIGKAENMTVSDEEYQSGLEELASQYGAESGEAFEEQYGKEDVENSILYDKIMDYVVDQAVVK